MSDSRLPTDRQGALAVFIILLLLVTAGQQVQAWSVYPGLLFTEFGLLLGTVLLLCRAWGLDAGRSLLLQRPHGLSTGRWLAAGTGIGLLAFVMAMGLTLPVLILVLLAGGVYPTLPLPLETGSHYLLALAAGAAAAPLCEEVVFRGFLLRSLGRHGGHVAVWAAAVCFGIFHLDPLRFIPTMALGVVYGYMARASGSVLPGIAAHALNNGLALTLAYASGASQSGGAESLSYETLKADLKHQMGTSTGTVAGLDADATVLLGLLVTAAMLLFTGLAMAGLIALVLRRLAAASSPEAEPLAPVPENGGTHGVLSNPWLWGVVAVGAVFWALGLARIFPG